MSAAKMVADSTQSDEPATKKNKINVKKNKKGKKAAEKKSKKKAAKEEPVDPYLDLSKDVRPIGDYWKKPAEMLEQMFDSVQGSSLNMILPEILMDMDIKELKSQCLEHLEVMSRKRIFRILAGDEPDAISSSGTEDEADIPTKFSGSCISAGNQQAADSTSNSTSDLKKANEIPDGSVDRTQKENPPDKDKQGNDSQNISNSTREIQATGGKGSLDSEDMSVEDEAKVNEDSNTNIETENLDSPEEGECSPGPKTESDGAELIPMLTQNHMELLELELRARAIKAMLKAQESHAGEQT